MEWEKSFENQISNKGLIFKIYNNSYNLIKAKQNNLTKEWTEELIRHFAKEDIKMAYSKRKDAPNH